MEVQYSVLIQCLLSAELKELHILFNALTKHKSRKLTSYYSIFHRRDQLLGKKPNNKPTKIKQTTFVFFTTKKL